MKRIFGFLIFFLLLGLASEVWAQSRNQVYCRVRGATDPSILADVGDFQLTLGTSIRGLNIRAGIYFYDQGNTNLRIWYGSQMDSETIADTNYAPYGQVGVFGFDGTDWRWVTSLSTLPSTLATTANPLVVLGTEYRFDGTNFVPALVGATGSDKVEVTNWPNSYDESNAQEDVNKKNTQAVTPNKQSETGIGTASVDIFDAREVIRDVNFCITVENTDGADPMVDIDILQRADSGGVWVDLGWDVCDTLAAGVACVYCVSGNAYRYIKVTGNAADGNEASTDVWYTANKN